MVFVLQIFGSITNMILILAQDLATRPPSSIPISKVITASWKNVLNAVTNDPLCAHEWTKSPLVLHSFTSPSPAPDATYASLPGGEPPACVGIGMSSRAVTTSECAVRAPRHLPEATSQTLTEWSVEEDLVENVN
jgi:hypothetical protein